MTKHSLYILLILALTPVAVFAQNIDFEQDDLAKRITFADAQYKRVAPVANIYVAKGQWLLGSTLAYTEHTNDNYKFLVAENFNSTGYNIAPKIFAGYAFADNTVGGVRLEYKRSMLAIDNLDVTLMDGLSINLKDISNERSTFHATIFVRNYLSIFNSNRFAIFADTELSAGGGRGKMLQGDGTEIIGTYEKISEFQIGIAPGISVFATDRIALEVAMGVLGFSSRWVKQYTNQVYVGTTNTNKGAFKVDLFSVKIGLVFYFNNKNFITNKLRK